MNAKKPSPLREAILETAEGMRRAGIMEETTFQKITSRQSGSDKPSEPVQAAPKSAKRASGRV